MTVQQQWSDLGTGDRFGGWGSKISQQQIKKQTGVLRVQY